MIEADRIKYLRVALLIVGLIFIFGLWPLTILWPSGWSWHAGGRSEYLEMIFGIYATLGVFLIVASRDPMAHRSLIWLTGLVESSCMVRSWRFSRSSIPSTLGIFGGDVFGVDNCGGRIDSPDPASECIAGGGITRRAPDRRKAAAFPRW